MSFFERYGPWAVIAGASEGTGRAFARQVAAQGLSGILIARQGLERLPRGPVQNWARVRMIAQSSKAVFGAKAEA